MNGHARRCRDALQALGFVEDIEITDKHSNGKTYYTHPLAPSEPLSLYNRMTEQVSRIVIDRARMIAGMEPTGAKRRSEQIRERQKRQREQRAAREARERAAVEQRAESAAVGVALREATRLRDARVRELRDLMQPGYGR